MKGIALVVVISAGTQAAFAQTVPVSRGFVVINGGYQLTTSDFGDGATKRENAEDGRFDTTYEVKSGAAFDIAGGGVLWRQLGVGVGVSRFSVSTPSALSATIPHPFFFNRPRSVSGDVAGLKREELARESPASPAGEPFRAVRDLLPSVVSFAQIGPILRQAAVDVHGASSAATTAIDQALTAVGF